MELTPATPQPVWSEPVAAYATCRPALSPYLHYWRDLCAARDPSLPQPPCHTATDGADIPDQMAQILCLMVQQSLG